MRELLLLAEAEEPEASNIMGVILCFLVYIISLLELEEQEEQEVLLELLVITQFLEALLLIKEAEEDMLPVEWVVTALMAQEVELEDIVLRIQVGLGQQDRDTEEATARIILGPLVVEVHLPRGLTSQLLMLVQTEGMEHQIQLLVLL